MTLYLHRLPTTEHGTFGVLCDEQGIPFAVTLERQWLNNEKGKSCIPAGEYICTRVLSQKFGNTFIVNDVPNRTHILFHKGNIDDDSHGCILIGRHYDPYLPEIRNSLLGFEGFSYKTKSVDSFLLIIKGG